MRIPISRILSCVLLILLVCFLVVSCSKSDGTDSSSAKLYLYNWSYYTPDEVIRQFEEEFNVQVILDYFTSNEEMFAKLMAGGGKGYDIIFPSGDYASIMISEGMLQQIDHSKLPNLQYISDMVLEKATYDPAMTWSVPYYMGAAGVAVNTEKVTGYERSWNIFSDTRLAGRMSMMDDMREVMGDALVHLGYSVNTTNAAQLKAAEELVKNEWKPNLVKFDADGFAKSFSLGEFWVVQGYAEAVFEEIPEHSWDSVDFFLPAEGGPMYIDSMCIPKGARNVDMAHEFINFIHRPEIYAKFLDRFHFPASVNSAAAAYTTTTPFYSVEDMANYELKDDLGMYLDLYNSSWKNIRYVD